MILRLNLFLLISISAVAEVKIDITSSTLTTIATDKIHIEGIRANNRVYEADLVWNPYAVQFQLDNAKQSSGTIYCSTGPVKGLGTLVNDGKITATQSTNKQISLTITSTRDKAFINLLPIANYLMIVQNGHQMALTTDSSQLGDGYGLVSYESGYSGTSGIPVNVSRTITVSSLPAWYDPSQPIQSIVYGETSYACS